MKKLSLLIAFLFCAIVSFAQFVNNPQGTPQQITQFRGAVTGMLSTVITPNDTTNSPATVYFGAMTVLPSDAGKSQIPIWISNGNYWVKLIGGSAFSRNDTIFTRIPIAVDTTSLPGHQILYLLHLDGVVTPGYVIWTGFGLIFNITPANYYINFRQFNSVSTTVTLSPADPSQDRFDLFIVDTTASATFLTGMAGGGVPQTNPSSQLPLTSILIRHGDTIPSGISLETIFNENLGNPTEFQTGVNGTPTVDYNNTDFPYIGTKAAFISKYKNGDAFTFTHNINDTVETGEILRGFVSFNIPFTNQFQFQLYNGSVPISNAIAINSGFGINPNNTGQYQIFAIPLNAFNYLNNSKVFNRLKITMSGADTSGAGGFYLDYLQFQKGLIFPTSGDFVDSVKTSNDSLFYYKHGLAIYGGSVGGGGGSETWQQTLINGSQLTQDNNVDLNGTAFRMQYDIQDWLLINSADGRSEVRLAAWDTTSNGYSEFVGQSNSDDGHKIFMSAESNGGNPIAISGNADTKIWTYTGDTHKFDGIIQFDSVHSGASTDSILTINASTGQVNKRDAASFIVLANNGLSKVLDSIQLGGNLTQNTTISGNEFTLSILGNVSSPNPQLKVNNTGSGEGINLNANSGTALESVSNSGYGAIITSTSGQGLLLGSATGLPLQIQANPATTNSVFSMIDMQRFSSGSVAAGIGQSIDYEIETSTGIGVSNSLISKWTDVTDATRTSQFSITGVNSGSTNILLTISGAGIFTLVQSLPSFANNAAAIGGGLTTNQLYRISAGGTSTVAIVQ